MVLRTNLLLVAAVAIAGCAPVFSDLQSARLAGPGVVEVTPGASTVHFSDGGPSTHVQDHYGIQVATGVQDRVDLRVRYERIVLDAGAEAEGGVNVLGFGPKLGLVRDRLALAVPVGFAFGGGVDSGQTWEAQPTLLGTLAAGRVVEITAAAKYIVPLGAEGADDLVALNIGLGLGPRDRWLFRPEIGFLWNPGEDGAFYHGSLGLTFLLGSRK
jgi:hypothetical protein